MHNTYSHSARFRVWIPLAAGWLRFFLSSSFWTRFFHLSSRRGSSDRPGWFGWCREAPSLVEEGESLLLLLFLPLPSLRRPFSFGLLLARCSKNSEGQGAPPPSSPGPLRRSRKPPTFLGLITAMSASGGFCAISLATTLAASASVRWSSCRSANTAASRALPRRSFLRETRKRPTWLLKAVDEYDNDDGNDSSTTAIFPPNWRRSRCADSALFVRSESGVVVCCCLSTMCRQGRFRCSVRDSTSSRRVSPLTKIAKAGCLDSFPSVPGRRGSKAATPAACPTASIPQKGEDAQTCFRRSKEASKPT
mmetsp:Transcript_16370/g.33907  ORF Transcript_16370/g.33907 Transcript_16370/m.33907 type:complete len:307 (-) Transcript_16370:22-942(-)